MIFNNIIIFIIILIFLYFFNLYFSLLLPKNYSNIIEGADGDGADMSAQNDVGTEPTNDDNYASDLSAVEIELSKYDILSNSTTSANAKSAISEYRKIMEKYQGILNNKIKQQESEEYKTRKTKEQTTINKNLCKLANSGILFAHKVFGNYCTYKNNSTECHGWVDNFDGWCKKEYGENKDFDKGMPSQLVYGQKEKYAGGCPGGMPGGGGGQGRAVCSTGYQGDQKLPLNSTQCYSTIGGDFDKACRDQAGNEIDYDIGIMSDHVFGVERFLDDGTAGCWAGQRRAKCALGHANGEKLKPNSTKCLLPQADFDNACREQVGNNQSFDPTKSIPSQEIWGQKSKYQGGCIDGQVRAECGKGLIGDGDGNQKLIDYSTRCGYWTDNFNKLCKETYGDDWILNTTLIKPDPTDNASGYGKYKGGCIASKGRGVCIKKTDISKDTELPGPVCGLSTAIGSSWCKDEFGPNYVSIGQKAYDCGALVRPICKDISQMDDGSPLPGNKCGEWSAINDSWCTDDYGSGWKYAKAIEDDCRWGQGKALCIKNPEIKWTECSNKWWGWHGDDACKKKFGPNSRYADNNVDCGAYGGEWYTSKYKCMTW